jgi:tetratricopeptide (TPR) repeat protein
MILKHFLFMLFCTASLFCATPIPREAQSLFKEALDFNSNGDYPSAISKYIEAYNISSQILGLNDEGIMRNATDFFENYLKSNPQDVNTLMWLGSISTIKGELSNAIEYYQRVMLYAPDAPEAQEADKEIIRLEEILKVQEQKKQIEFQQKQQEAQLKDRMRTNLEGEIKQEYEDKIQSLQAEIDNLRSENEKLRSNQADAGGEVEQLKQKIAELEEENTRHRRLYLYYRRKAK